MAQIILSNVSVSLGDITIGANAVKSVTINYTPEEKDNTGMGHTAKSRKMGLEDWSIDIEIFQEYATGLLDADLYAIIKAGGDVGAIDIGPTGVAADADNPHYESTAGYLGSYSPVVAGSVGELGVAKLHIVAMGAELTREVS
jgi:hypothetical protein